MDLMEMAQDYSLLEMREENLLCHLLVSRLHPSEDKLREKLLTGADEAELTEELLPMSCISIEATTVAL